jgi:hypothetical protein
LNDITQAHAPALDFVRQLDIAVAGSGRLWRAASPAAFSEDRPQPASAYVGGASVAAFTDGIYGQQREDLLNSTLLAQLSANQAHAREGDTLDWYAWYRRVLLKLGWQRVPTREPKQLPPLAPRRDPRLQLHRHAFRIAPRLQPGPHFPRPPRPHGAGQVADPAHAAAAPFTPFKPVDIAEPRFSADGAALTLLRNKVDSAALHGAEAALEALRGLDQRDRRTQIFESNAHRGASGNFQIISASAVSEQLLSMTMACCFFATSEPVTRLLGFHFGRTTTTMHQACDTLTLDAADYAPLRAQVIDQLGDQAAAFIDEIDLA